MNGEDRFYLGVWAIIATIIITTIISSNIFYSGQEQRVVDMVAAGATPIEASCAIYDAVGNSPTCVALVANKGK